ncbi:MAG: hypothetical protein NUW37_05190 [Planctomycetes bacterium]|nr:hypothetical protein [Planctomycetota bacterium]
MRQLSIKEIQPGMVVGQPVEDSAGRILLKPGDTIKDVYIQLLSKRGIKSVYIRDEASVEADMDSSQESVRLTEEEIDAYQTELDRRFKCHEGNKHMNVIKKIAAKYGLKILVQNKVKSAKTEKDG